MVSRVPHLARCDSEGEAEHLDSLGIRRAAPVPPAVPAALPAPLTRRVAVPPGVAPAVAVTAASAIAVTAASTVAVAASAIAAAAIAVAPAVGPAVAVAVARIRVPLPLPPLPAHAQTGPHHMPERAGGEKYKTKDCSAPAVVRAAAAAVAAAALLAVLAPAAALALRGAAQSHDLAMTVPTACDPTRMRAPRACGARGPVARGRTRFFGDADGDAERRADLRADLRPDLADTQTVGKQEERGLMIGGCGHSEEDRDIELTHAGCVFTLALRWPSARGRGDGTLFHCSYLSGRPHKPVRGSRPRIGYVAPPNQSSRMYTNPIFPPKKGSRPTPNARREP